MNLLLIVFLVSVVNSQFYCADQLQQCGSAIQEIEQMIREYKNNAFNGCVKKQACREEKEKFDSCFESSVEAVRGSVDSNDTSSEFFVDNAMKYKASLDQCFVISPFVPRRNRFGPSILDDDAAYARGIYGYDIADKLWGLLELGITRPSLDSDTICKPKTNSLRVFGSGISRTHPSSDPKLNNILGSCMLDEKEISCYRQQLDHDPQYIQLVYNRDYTLRACIQTIREQTVCKLRDVSRLRACLCSVREQFDVDVESSLLQCVKENKRINFDEKMPTVSESLDSGATHLQQQVEASNMKFDTPGAIINGQCMCSCNSPTSFTTEDQNGRSMAVDQTIQSSFAKHMKTMKTIEEKEIKNTEDVKPKFSNAPRLIRPKEAEGLVLWGFNDTFSLI